MKLEESQFMYNLGAKIKEIRIRKGITVEVIAEKCNMSLEQYLDVESGSQTLLSTEFLIIIKALDEDPDSFFNSI